ncbi:MAG: DNA-processing protein DprA [Porticoccaceae bacterium]
MDTEVRTLVALSLAPEISPSSLRELLQRSEPLSSVFAQSSSAVSGVSTKAARQLLTLHGRRDEAVAEADKTLRWCRENQVHCLTLLDKDYPPLLKEIAGAPPLLFVRGDPLLLSLPQLAMVGSRSASPQGIRTAEQFAGALAAHGFAITSGLALGIDAAAHRGALLSGKTVAVLGTGVDVVYPRQHRQLYQQIVDQGGAIVSEFPPGTAPLPSHFPRRNRLISGLSLGVLVVEAALRSGSLITARYALEQGREVFAIPGSIHNPLSKGNHQLLKEGAALVESAADIVVQLGGMLGYLAEEISPETSLGTETGNILWDALGFDSVDMDTLVERTGLSVKDVTHMLMLLELDGKVVSINGCYQRQD